MKNTQMVGTFTKSITCAAFCCLAACSSGSSSDDTATTMPMPAPEPEQVATQTISTQLQPTSSDDFFDTVALETAGLTNIVMNSPSRYLGSDQNNAGVFTAAGYGESDDGLTYFSFAGIDLSPQLAGTVVETGTVTYAANYLVSEYVDIASGPTERNMANGNITLTADFTQNVITGDDGLLAVSGTLNDTAKAFDGDVTWRGVDGEIEGMASSSAVLGAFQGSSDDTVYAGLLSGTPIEE